MFHAVRTTGDTDNCIYNSGLIHFDSILFKTGGGMSTDWTFTVPQPGNYMFVLSGTSYNNRGKIVFALKKNDGEMSTYYVIQYKESDMATSFTKTFLLKLDTGEQVYINKN
jgi:hypothetical protein